MRLTVENLCSVAFWLLTIKYFYFLFFIVDFIVKSPFCLAQKGRFVSKSSFIIRYFILPAVTTKKVLNVRMHIISLMM